MSFKSGQYFGKNIVILNKHETLLGTIIMNNLIKRCIDR